MPPEGNALLTPGVQLQVLVADDHQMVSEGLQFMLEKDSRVAAVRTAGTVEEIFTALAARCPDIFLLDIDLGTNSGLDLIEQIRDHCPSTTIILLTADKRVQTLQEALRRNIDGYQLKDAPVRTLIEAMLKAREGHLVLPAEIGAVPSEAGPSAAGEDTTARLTARETEVYHLLLQGRDNRQIAQELSLSVNTVKTHVRKVMRKLAVHKRAHLLQIPS